MFNKNKFANNLLTWFKYNKQDVPWRKNRTPYSIWISEIMLQQTVIKTVIPYYKKWLKKYPNIRTLAQASETNVLQLWEGLGYYSRAKNILKTAKNIVEKYQGKIPADYHKLIRLPGIGDYTASAILSIAFELNYPVIDVNVKRVLHRIFALDEWNKNKEDEIKIILSELMRFGNPGNFNEALMELGQTICLIRNPRCDDCCLASFCMSLKKGIQNKISEKSKQKIIYKQTILLLLIYKNQILLQKNNNKLFNGLWLLPSIVYNSKKRNESEANQFIQNTISKNFIKNRELKPRNHYYTRYQNKLFPYLYNISKPNISLPNQMKWVKLKVLQKYPVPSVYRKILTEL